jgi:DNA repair exonuclease SbcCD nuclease subunit
MPIALDPDPAFRHNILITHRAIEGVLPAPDPDSERAALQITPKELGAQRWSYVALGHYHVFRQIEPNAYICGAIEYTSTNIWGELLEEKTSRIGGKGMIEFDLETGKRTFHPIAPARALVDLPLLSGRGMTAADLDEGIRQNISRVAGGIDGKIVRQVIRDVPRHIAREMDYKALREYRRRALHFQLDTRRPEVVRTSASGAPGRRPSLTDTVRDKLRGRHLPPDVDREQLVELGLRYLREADTLETAALSATTEHE